MFLFIFLFAFFTYHPVIAEIQLTENENIPISHVHLNDLDNQSFLFISNVSNSEIINRSLKGDLINTTKETSVLKTQYFSNLSQSSVTPSIYNGLPICSNFKNFRPTATVEMIDLFTRIDFNNYNPGWRNEFEKFKNDNNQSVRNVTLVMFSHTDAGWQVPYQKYYNTVTKILNTFSTIGSYPASKAIWNDISFLAAWWSEQFDGELTPRSKFYEAVQSKQIEITTGGWVMPDEATPHWTSILLQLTLGHQWVTENLKVHPKHAFSIDAFGYSPTVAYLYKLAGLESIFIVRVNEAIRKYFAYRKQLQFLWRQPWDPEGLFDIFVYIYPYMSYDFKTSCGLNPRICWELYVYKEETPFRNEDDPNNDPDDPNNKNCTESWFSCNFSNFDNFELNQIARQFRDTTKYYKFKSVLIPVGSDFEYSDSRKFNSHSKKFDLLFKELNNNPEKHQLNIVFGTLTEFYNNLFSNRNQSSYPSYIGDLFLYSDDIFDQFWSGFYTTRPFYKEWDRILMNYIRSAEILTSLTLIEGKYNNWLINTGWHLLQSAIQNYSIFQHHDAITGTSHYKTVQDYGKRLLDATQKAEIVITNCIQLLLQNEVSYAYPIQHPIYEPIEIFDNLKEMSKNKIFFTQNKNRYETLVLFNSLTFSRSEMIFLNTKLPYISIQDYNGTFILCQSFPSMSTETFGLFYKIAFSVNIPALSIASYKLTASQNHTSKNCKLSRIEMYNMKQIYNIGLPFYQRLKRDSRNIYIQNKRIVAHFFNNGLLQFIVVDAIQYTLQIDFYKYENDYNNGAYIFNPQNLANLQEIKFPFIVVKRGPLVSSVTMVYSLENRLTINHTVSLYNNEDNQSIKIETYLVLGGDRENTVQMVMRIRTEIENHGRGFVDVNGFQILQRENLYLVNDGGNYRPISNMAYIEDDRMRLTVISKSPRGVAFLQEGCVDLMLDRFLRGDDSRLGMEEPIDEPVLTRHTFELILEKRLENKKPIPNHPSGFASPTAHLASIKLQYPMIKLKKILLSESGPEIPRSRKFYELNSQLNYGIDILLVSLKPFVFNDDFERNNIGIVVHRTTIDEHFQMDLENNRTNSILNLNLLFPQTSISNSFETSITFMLIKNHSNLIISDLCPMHIKAFIIIIDFVNKFEMGNLTHLFMVEPYTDQNGKNQNFETEVTRWFNIWAQRSESAIPTEEFDFDLENMLHNSSFRNPFKAEIMNLRVDTSYMLIKSDQPSLSPAPPFQIIFLNLIFFVYYYSSL